MSKISTDSLVIVRDLQQRRVSEWLLLPMFDDVLFCIDKLCNVVISKVHRSGVQEAHSNASRYRDNPVTILKSRLL